jgi:hypothetical protein
MMSGQLATKKVDIYTYVFMYVCICVCMYVCIHACKLLDHDVRCHQLSRFLFPHPVFKSASPPTYTQRVAWCSCGALKTYTRGKVGSIPACETRSKLCCGVDTANRCCRMCGSTGRLRAHVKRQQSADQAIPCQMLTIPRLDSAIVGTYNMICNLIFYCFLPVASVALKFGHL